MSQDQSAVDWPTVQDLVTRVPLYFPYDISGLSDGLVRRVFYFNGAIDAYCVGCKQKSVFVNAIRNTGPLNRENMSFDLNLKCSRFTDHLIVVYLIIREEKLIKVGQYPSLADLQLPDLSRYQAILGEEDRREFARAIGLKAHGIGIGSFVYLRRIFEKLVEGAHTEARALPGWDEQSYQTAPMDQKIQLLKDQLPVALVENAGIYSILSAGIHTLNEDQCLSYFDVMKLGIEMILDQEVERVRKEKQEGAFKSKLGKIIGQVRKNRT
jgi:hypothetical protein